MGNFSFILLQSPWPPQETPPSIGRRNGLLSSWPPELASWPPKLASWPPELASSENFYFISPQSPWPPQETPPTIGRRNGLLSSWPVLRATHPEWELFFYFGSIINRSASGSGLRKKQKVPKILFLIIINIDAESRK